MKCKFNDCGWCYSKDEQTNDTQGQCNNPQECVVNIEQSGGKMNSIETLKHHNEWRRGSDTEMLNPTELGKAIESTPVQSLADIRADGIRGILEKADYFHHLELDDGDVSGHFVSAEDIDNYADEVGRGDE